MNNFLCDLCVLCELCVSSFIATQRDTEKAQRGTERLNLYIALTEVSESQIQLHL